MPHNTSSYGDNSIIYPQVRFGVLSDPHFYDLSLGTKGRAFASFLERYREIKMFQDAPEIMDAALTSLAGESLDFVLICGDLTKDGEISSHKFLAEKLRLLLQQGTQVFVINGNHDVANQRACRYTGDQQQRVASVSAEEFAQIYADFGYRLAFSRDPNSLSYAVEPVPGLCILALDSCCWQKGFREEGELSPATLAWAEGIMVEANQTRKAVLAMMHHGILEHYPGNEKYYSAYLIKDHKKISRSLAASGLKAIFTGHFHSQDIAFRRWQGGNTFLFDIETGSLITYPCPYRLVTIDAGQNMHICSKRIAKTVSHPLDFPEYAHHYSYELALRIGKVTLRRWFISEKDANLLSPQVVEAFRAHGLGNEGKSEQVLDLTGVGLWGRLIMQQKRGLLQGLWDNSPPPDNGLTIQLETGNYT